MINKLITNERVILFLFISMIEYLSTKILYVVPRNDFYFLVSGFINYSTLLILSKFFRSKLSIALSKLIFIQLSIQFIGWVLYYFYFQPYLYNFSINVMVVLTYIRILIIGEKEDGNIEGYPHHFFVRRDDLKRRAYYYEVRE